MAPPDLSVIARSRGADWLYTYLRTFYRDDRRATGWNNLVFPERRHAARAVGAAGRAGARRSKQEHEGARQARASRRWCWTSPATLSPVEYDKLVADLVNYLVFMGEPAARRACSIGYVVLIVLGVLFVLVYLLKKEYWKDVH